MTNRRMVINMKALIEMVYKIAKKYMLNKAKDTGNDGFVKQLEDAFTSVEDAWVKINNVGK